MKRRTLVVVPHTHWDREWYLPFESYRVRLVGMMDRLLDLLDREPRFPCFLLDGQTALLEDYLEARPERGADLERHAAAGRLLVGPWYVLPDEFLVGGEALLRNLSRGLRVARRFGGPMMVGYLPDCFGHIAHMPSLLRGFGIGRAVIWRGADDSLAKTEFFWRAPDGSEVLTIHLPQGYSFGQTLPLDRDDLEQRLRRILAELEPRATTPYLLLLNGSDHLPAQEEMPSILDTARELLPDHEVVHGHLPMVFDGVEAAMGDDPSPEGWPRRKGEFRSGQRAPLLPGVLSTRTWIKQRNQECEDLLARWAEPLSTWAALARRRLEASPGAGWRPTALPPGPRSPHPDDPAAVAGLLDVAWRHLLLNQPHDSICGCSIDQVHDEMRARFDRCQQIGEEVTRQAMRALATQVDAGPGDHPQPAWGAIVFNPEHGPRSDFVTVTLPVRNAHVPLEMLGADGGRSPCQPLGEARPLAPEGGTSPLGPVASVEAFQRVEVGFVARDVPGFGYKAYRAVLARRDGPRPRRPTATAIENEFFRVEADPADGTLSVIDRASGRLLSGLNRFVDGGDRGDEYNYCRPERDDLVERPVRPPRVRAVEAGPARWTLEVSLTYSLPRSLVSQRDGRSRRRVACPIVSRVSLYPGVRRIDIHTVVDNRAKDHRLRVHFPSDVVTDVSHAEQHFGVVTRPIDLPPHDETWADEPVGTYPQKAFVDVNDSDRGLMIANRGLPEYEVLPADPAGRPLRRGVTIALTLLRCVGFLALSDLTSRPGLAGPPLPAPGAQMIGRHAFDYAIIPHEGGWESAYVEAHRFARPLRARRLPQSRAVPADAGLPAQSSLLDVSSPAFVVTALKRAEDGAGVIVRLYNTLSAPAECDVRLTEPFDAVKLAAMDESTVETLPSRDGRVHLEARPNQVLTLRFRTAPL